jgi:NADH dehydrogenase
MAGSVVITGAFSYTGKYATGMLVDRGYEVRTLTNHPSGPPDRPNLFGERVRAFPYDFDRPDELRRNLRGAATLINTYWVRFPRGKTNFETAVRNSRILIAAAKDAGVRRIVHVSIANPSIESSLGYYKGKAEVEEAVMTSGLSYAILRPTVIFGAEDILINNIAWFVRHLPVFGIPGDGRYRIRPIYVADMAELLVESVEREGNSVRDAVGPETFSFEELVRLIGRSVDRDVRLVHVPTVLAYLSTLLAGRIVKDVVLTWEEYRGLMDNLLASGGPATGETRLSEWLLENSAGLGGEYASEVGRHYLDAKTPHHGGHRGHRGILEGL